MFAVYLKLMFLYFKSEMINITLHYRTADENDLNLGTSFSAETNRRDEDADM